AGSTGSNLDGLSRLRKPRAAVLEILPLFPGVENLTGCTVLELADDAVFGHEVDQAGGAAVTDAQCPLKQRARTSPFSDDDLDGCLVKLVALFERLAALLA